MPKSTFLSNSFLNASLRDTPYTSPTTVYVALYTTAPTSGGGGVEVSGGSYSRQPVTWSAPTSGVSSNVADIVYPTATADWGVITSFGVFDAITSGNLLYFANLGASRTVLNTDQFKFPAGQLTCSET